ncbi:DoxX family protein [Thioclava sp. 15-R06ZXC-3]|uniref:DoxX family protein n=1 Tax=Thioclava arctica TaxID=3238301 RepID=A0ABV3TI70_9RHOB
MTFQTLEKSTNQRLIHLYSHVTKLGGRIPDSVVLLAARLFPAVIFWQSGRTKVDGLSIKDSTYTLFEQIYALPVIPPHIAAVAATFAEHLMPIFLVLGLFTRASALALLVMTLVIQIFVFPDAWLTHGLWAICFLIVIAKGPGVLSLDKILRLER